MAASYTFPLEPGDDVFSRGIEVYGAKEHPDEEKPVRGDEHRALPRPGKARRGHEPRAVVAHGDGLPGSRMAYHGAVVPPLVRLGVVPLVRGLQARHERLPVSPLLASSSHCTHDAIVANSGIT